MTLQNRVMPTGEIVAIPVKGSLMGNRGILHDERQQLGQARWRHKNWVCCSLTFNGRKRALMAPGTYTELFFHDEAVACAAGHRPCAECRRTDFLAFQAAWKRSIGPDASAHQIDATLHKARVNPRTRQQITHVTAMDTLPDGVFISLQEQSYLVAGATLLPFQGHGYGAAIPRVNGRDVTVLTPAPLVEVMRAGWRPAFDPSLGHAIR